MTVTLKRLLEEAGAGMDESNGMDTLYDVISALILQTNDLTDQFNQLLADHNTATDPDSTATVVTKDVATEG